MSESVYVSDVYERLYPCLENLENEGSTNLITQQQMDKDPVIHVKGTGTGDLIWLKVVSLERS